MERAKKDFDFSCEISSPHYFKSSFAKSMAVESKSLDYSSVNQMCEKNEKNVSSSETHFNDINKGKFKKALDNNVFDNSSHSVFNGTSGYDAYAKSPQRASFRRENNKLWNLKPDNVSRPKSDESDSDVIRLRKECQILLEENRWLRGTEGAALQSQVDTLHWQLKHTESSRLMYRQVLEQVAKFLDRTHTTLDALESSRVPVRARSVYSVDSSDIGLSIPRTQSATQMGCRPLSRTMSNVHVERPVANGQTADGLPNYTAFRDYTWRRAKKEQLPSNQSPEKIAKEAFRLLRTVQSLLSTQEPELAHKHPSSIIEESAAEVEEHFQLLDIQRDGYESQNVSAIHNSQLPSSTYATGSPLTNGLDTQFASVEHLPMEPSQSAVRSVSTVSSTEDESGFSSMSSFQEVGLPPHPPPSSHRRWGSSPADTHAQYYERLHVLWV